MGTLSVMDRTGDTKLIWNSGNADEAAAARKTFTDLKAKGFVAYSVKKKGARGKALAAFDPDAEKIIMSPPMAGG